MVAQQNIMKCIEENSERLDLLQKTLSLEEKQRKRLLDITLQKQKEIESANQMKLYDGSTATNNSLLDQEDSLRKELADSMNQTSTPALTPVVRVLNNVQGKYQKYFFYSDDDQFRQTDKQFVLACKTTFRF